MTSLFHNSSLFYRQIILLRIALYLSSSTTTTTTTTTSTTTAGGGGGSDVSGSGSSGSCNGIACCNDPYHRLASTTTSGSGSGNGSSNGSSGNNIIAIGGGGGGSAYHQIISLFLTFLNQPVLPTSLAMTMSSVGSERRKKILECIEIIMQMNEDYFQDFLQGDLLSSLSMILHSDGYDGKVEAGYLLCKLFQMPNHLEQLATQCWNLLVDLLVSTDLILLQRVLVTLISVFQQGLPPPPPRPPPPSAPPTTPGTVRSYQIHYEGCLERCRQRAAFLCLHPVREIATLAEAVLQSSSQKLQLL